MHNCPLLLPGELRRTKGKPFEAIVWPMNPDNDIWPGADRRTGGAKFRLGEAQAFLSRDLWRRRQALYIIRVYPKKAARR